SAGRPGAERTGVSIPQGRVPSGRADGPRRSHAEAPSATISATPNAVAARINFRLVARRAVADDRQLRGFDVERLELARAAVLILRGDGEADDAGRRVRRHDPFRHPEGPLRLLRGGAPPHRDVLDLPRVVQ